MSYALTFVGFAALIILHEAGHFAAAKATGMRVERFSLFFGRTPLRFVRGETEYGVGWIPAGGFVKITGMSPVEELPEAAALSQATAAGAPAARIAELQAELAAVEARAYINQPPWKRIVVILAGPAVNVVIAFVILLAIFLTSRIDVMRDGQYVTRGAVIAGTTGPPARGVLKSGDQLLAIDGHKVASLDAVGDLISSHRCAGAQVNGCRAATAVTFTILRHGQRTSVTIVPRYDAAVKAMRIGVEIEPKSIVTEQLGLGGAAGHSISTMGSVTATTVTHIAQLFKAKDRQQLHGIVGTVNVVQQDFSFDTTQAFYVLALISLSLAIVNLFPFLPLDGGHVFWAVAEKLRGRRIPFSIMERAGVIGFVLILILFVVGLSNDINHPIHVR